MAFGIDDAIAAGLQIINKFVPDPQQKAQAALEMAQLKAAHEQAELQSDTQIAIAQNDVNKAEAMSGDKWAVRARPVVEYVCAAGFAYHYVVEPFLLFLVTAFGAKITVPVIDMTSVTSLLVVMCGARSYEKLKGVA